LSEYGIKEADFDKIIDNISAGSMVTNPIILNREELFGLLKARL
jgi:alcohol dehydrogenase class IV